MRVLSKSASNVNTDAYGWPVTLTGEEIFERLVALNHERAEEEKRGIVHWLRPEYQNPSGKQQRGAELVDANEAEGGSGKLEVGSGKKAAGKKSGGAKAKPAKLAKRSWPKTIAEQAAAVGAVLAATAEPANEAMIAKAFTRADKARLAELLATLAAIGKARQLGDGRYVGA